MINFALPGMYEHYQLYFKLLDLKRNHPEYFYEDININAIYGNPQFCIWDGGRIFLSYEQANREMLEDIIHIYNYDFQTPIRYVFTNRCLEEKHYHDRFGNILMELGSHSGNNEVVVSDDNFLNYLKTTYPNYKYISSTTKCLTDKNELKKELNREDYNLVCLDYNFNYDIEFLKTFSEKEKNKSELLINTICNPKCLNREHHYFKNSQSHLNYGREYHMEYCNIIKNKVPGCLILDHHITYDKIKEIYEPLGFLSYKLEGRTWSDLHIAIMCCNYLIKPEYFQLVLINLIE